MSYLCNITRGYILRFFFLVGLYNLWKTNTAVEHDHFEICKSSTIETFSIAMLNFRWVTIIKLHMHKISSLTQNWIMGNSPVYTGQQLFPRLPYQPMSGSDFRKIYPSKVHGFSILTFFA